MLNIFSSGQKEREEKKDESVKEGAKLPEKKKEDVAVIPKQPIQGVNANQEKKKQEIRLFTEIKKQIKGPDKSVFEKLSSLIRKPDKKIVEEVKIKEIKEEPDRLKKLRELSKKTSKIDERSKSIESKLDKIQKVIVDKGHEVYATKKGTRYHNLECITIKGLPKQNLRKFANKKEAEKEKLKPCNVCILKK